MSLLKSLIRDLQNAGFDSALNKKYKTIDITAIRGRPLLDPWALDIDESALKIKCEAVRNLRRHEDKSFTLENAYEEVFTKLQQDIEIYPPLEGPFGLDDYGQVFPANPSQPFESAYDEDAKN